MTTVAPKTTTSTRGRVEDLGQIRSFIERHRGVRELPQEKLTVTFSNKAVAAEYFVRFFDICEELLSRVEDHDIVLQQIASRLGTQREVGSSRRDLQMAVLVRLENALSMVPDGTYLAISYEGKILARASSQSELARVMSDLTIPLAQTFVYRKGRPAAFGEL